MNNLITKIFWNLHSYCSYECTYCPSNFRHGQEPNHISDYLIIAQKLIDNYCIKQNRIINWTFNGGEPLELFDLPEFLKFCKVSNGTIDLTTNGGKLWVDWWALEPHIDYLHLSYHYWQNPNLIKFIIQIFQKKNKFIEVIVPLRSGEHFLSDWNRAISLEQDLNLVVNKKMLHKQASSQLGFLEYTEDQYELVFGKQWVIDNFYKPAKNFQEINVEQRDSSPSFTGKLCNVGVESLIITGDGWVKGSFCNNIHLGNIWSNTFSFPEGPSKCKMISCINSEDQKITKFI